MRRLTVLTIALLAVGGPLAGGAHAQSKTTTAEPQVVEPQPGEAITPPATTTPPTGATGPATPTTGSQAAPAASGATGASGPTGQAGATVVVQQSSDSSDDTGLLIGAIVLGVIIIAAIVIALLWRIRGWDPRWRRRWRHANAEASWRISLGWAEFRDFMRLGR